MDTEYSRNIVFFQSSVMYSVPYLFSLSKSVSVLFGRGKNVFYVRKIYSIDC